MSEEITIEDIQRAKDRQRTVNAYHRVLSCEDGKLILADLKASFGFSFPAFVSKDGIYDVTHAAIRDGQRQVILHLDVMMAEEAKGDANVDEPEVTVTTE